MAVYRDTHKHSHNYIYMESQLKITHIVYIKSIVKSPCHHGIAFTPPWYTTHATTVHHSHHHGGPSMPSQHIITPWCMPFMPSRYNIHVTTIHAITVHHLCHHGTSFMSPWYSIPSRYTTHAITVHHLGHHSTSFMFVPSFTSPWYTIHAITVHHSCHHGIPFVPPQYHTHWSSSQTYPVHVYTVHAHSKVGAHKKNIWPARRHTLHT